MDGNDGLLVGGVDGLEGLTLDTLHPLAVDVQADGLLVGDAGGFDLCCQRHDCELLFEELGIKGEMKVVKGFNRQNRKRSRRWPEDNKLFI